MTFANTVNIPPFSGQGIKVLIIEDEFVMAMMLEDMLDQLGCLSVKKAGNFTEAERLIKADQFDIAVLDVNLQGRSTFQLADQLTAKDIPYFFSTGYSKGAIPVPYNQNLILQKPFTLEQLLSHLLKALVDS
jgi:CheY-like chemotaxis protein